MKAQGVFALTFAACTLAAGTAAATDQGTAQTASSWHSPSLTMETVTAANGAVTTQTQLEANALWGLTETTAAEKAAEGDPQVRHVELRNSVLVITDADAKAATHVDVTRSELTDFVRGTGTPARAGGELLAKLDGVLDRSQLMPAEAMKPEVLDDKGDPDYTHGLEH